jgi:polar amino acid transport system substrate-binding protein
MGPGNTDKQLQMMIDLESTVICATSSYALLLAEEINRRGLRDQIKLKKGVIGSERWSEAKRKYIADALGLELEVVPMDFDGTISELGNKSVDLGIAGYSPDPKRESMMNFSDIYYQGGQSFVTSAALADSITSMEVANDPKCQIGAQVGSIQVDLAKENTPDADIVELTKVTDIIAELLAGTLDGAFIETAVAESYQKNYPDLKIVCDVPYDQEGSAVGVNKDNAALLAAVNLIIAQVLEDGTMDQFDADANELASGTVYEGLLDENGKVVED